MDERHVRETRQLPSHRPIDLNLPERVGQVVVAADDVGDAHVVVVHHDGVVVGRRAVAAQDDQVVEILVGEHHTALHAILDHGLPLARRLEANNWWDAHRRFLFIAVAPTVSQRGAGRPRHLAHCGKLLGARIAAISFALRE